MNTRQSIVNLDQVVRPIKAVPMPHGNANSGKPWPIGAGVSIAQPMEGQLNAPYDGKVPAIPTAKYVTGNTRYDLWKR